MKPILPLVGLRLRLAGMLKLKERPAGTVCEQGQSQQHQDLRL